MSWTDIFPVLTDQHVDAYLEHASEAEMEQLELWFGVERVVNRQEGKHLVAASLFWKNINGADDELPVPTRELLMNAAELGLVKRFAPWEHYFLPLLEGAKALRVSRPDVVFRVYLAADLAFFVEDLANVGCEIFLMNGNSLRHSPGAMWRYLALEEEGRLVTVTDADRARLLVHDVERTELVAHSGLAHWRSAYTCGGQNDEAAYYRPILSCQFGSAVHYPTGLWMRAMVWHTLHGTLADTVCVNGVEHRAFGASWPDYGFDEWFLLVAMFTRMAQNGVLSFVSWDDVHLNQWFALDIEYCTWANPRSEILHYKQDKVLHTQRVSVGFATFGSPRHIQAYYSGLIEFLQHELGGDFEVMDCRSDAELAARDGEYRLVIFGTRESAQYCLNHWRMTKSMLVDHGPLHSNRTARINGHFEVFSSPYLKDIYTKAGIGPLIKGWSGGYFLTDHLDSSSPRKGECMVYLIHMHGWRANSLTHEPFGVEETCQYLCNLAEIFHTVHVCSHLNGGENFVVLHREVLPSNVTPVTHGPVFWSLVNNVEAVFFEYSSVFAIALWNPRVTIFQRVPKHPSGPVMMHAAAFHQIMDSATYPILDDDLSNVGFLLEHDPKYDDRCRAKDLIYDGDISDPYAAILAAVKDALIIITNEEEHQSCSTIC